MKACNDLSIPFIMSMNTETTEFMSKAQKYLILFAIGLIVLLL